MSEKIAEIYGYPGFDTAATYFRTSISRGWSGQHGSAVITKNRVHCSYLPLGLSQNGLCFSRGYAGNPTFPPGDAYVVAGSDSCNDGFLSFYDFPWHTSISNILIQGISLYDSVTSELVVAGGFEHLLNPIVVADVLQEIKEAVRSAAWSGVGGGSSPSNFGAHAQRREIVAPGGVAPDDLIGLLLRKMRYRWKFKVPDAGSYSISWTISWIPLVWDAGENDFVDGTPEIFDDQNKWRWDEVVPGSYDPEDDTTWPLTPWFEMPEPQANGKFRITAVLRSCDSAAAPDAPAEISFVVS
ncbi:hypothetical protein [Horticoccus sp. 23ND18S-11]|uniref:hypothetical protein n=1 Tax=Horticoccus sp. 23ND18S-11 TaxID=3391832 RepID=UPI0039C9FA36